MSLFAAAIALATAPQGIVNNVPLKVSGGNPGPAAYTISDVEIEPPAKKTEGAATFKLILTPARPGLVVRNIEVRLLYRDRGFGGSGRAKRDAPQPHGIPAGSVRYAANPETARLGCMDPLQARQLVSVEYAEGDRERAETYLVPFTWVDRFPTLDGRCHIPKD